MRKRSLLLGLFLWYALATVALQPVRAQENGRERQGSEETETHNEPDFKWHVVNTAIFALLVGVAYVKLGPSFFNARAADIQKAIKDATGLKIEADFRSSEIDRKMATLPDEVKRMREQARVEMEREHERRRAETEARIRLMENSLAAEIAGMRADSSYRIRQLAARQAFRQAELRLRERMGQDGDGELMGDFVRLVERGTTA